MSARMAGPGTVTLWWVRPVGADLRIDEHQGHLFSGDRPAMVAHIADLHRRTGVQHAARQVQ